MKHAFLLLISLLVLLLACNSLLGVARVDTPRQQLVISHTQKQKNLTIEVGNEIRIWIKKDGSLQSVLGTFTIPNDSTIQIQGKDISINEIHAIKTPGTGKTMALVYIGMSAFTAGLGGLMLHERSRSRDPNNPPAGAEAFSNLITGVIGYALLLGGVIALFLSFGFLGVAGERKSMFFGKKISLKKKWKLSVRRGK